MTLEQIIEMAKQVGMTKLPGKWDGWSCHLDELQAFAQLVRNAALEEAASVVEGLPFIQDDVAYRKTRHAGSWQEKSTVGLFVTANTKKIRSLKK